MKRSSKPLRRSKALRAGRKPFSIAAFVNREVDKLVAQSKPRKPIPRRGARSARTQDELEAMRDTVLARARGRCEMCGWRDNRLEVHHCVPRARGVGWPGLHSPANGAALCRRDHEAVTLDPLAILDCRGELGTRAVMVWEQFRAWRAGQGLRSPKAENPEPG